MIRDVVENFIVNVTPDSVLRSSSRCTLGRLTGEDALPCAPNPGACPRFLQTDR
jgi:hypothetical protein